MARTAGVTLLLDADIIAFKFASAHEDVFYWNGKENPPSVVTNWDACVAATAEYIKGLGEKLGATRLVVCLSDPDANFRKGLWSGYKANRAGLRKPEMLKAVKEWMAATYQTYQRPALEADDCMGILSTHPSLVPGQKIIVSEDKDMQSIPGYLFNPAKDEQPRKITRIQADRYHLWQTIVGDTSDGYPGAKGVGPQSPEAQAVLVSKTVTEAWNHVLTAFTRKGFNEEDALLQARLARILRAEDWEFRSKTPKLWTPG